MAKLLSSVQGLRVLVTGGCSGLGAATAARLLDRGARVLIVDLHRGTSASEAPVPPPLSKALYQRADITDEAEVSSAIDFAAQKLGGLDALVNCAGVAFTARFYNWNTDCVFSLEDFRTIFRVNVVGTFNVCRLAARLMAKNGSGSELTVAAAASRGVIVNTSSMSAFDGQTTQVMYAGSKAAVAAMTLPMARDLAPIGVRVCCIAPGYFDSRMSNRKSFSLKVQKFLADHNRAIYRLGRPDEFAQAVETILLNPMLNGVTVRLDAANRGFFCHRRKTAVVNESAADDNNGESTGRSKTAATMA